MTDSFEAKDFRTKPTFKHEIKHCPCCTGLYTPFNKDNLESSPEFLKAIKYIKSKDDNTKAEILKFLGYIEEKVEIPTEEEETGNKKGQKKKAKKANAKFHSEDEEDVESNLELGQLLTKKEKIRMIEILNFPKNFHEALVSYFKSPHNIKFHIKDPNTGKITYARNHDKDNSHKYKNKRDNSINREIDLAKKIMSN